MNDILSSVVSFGRSVSPGRQGHDRFEDVELGETSGYGAAARMHDIYQESADIKALLRSIASLHNQVAEMHAAGKVLVSSQEIALNSQQCQAKVDEVRLLAQKVKTRLERLNKTNEEIFKDPECLPGSAVERTRTQITHSLWLKFKRAIDQFNDLRDTIDREHRELIRNRVYVVNARRLTDEELNEMIATGSADNLFKTQLLDAGKSTVLATVAEIDERHRAVQQLERSLLNLLGIFSDLALYVQQQGELLSRVDENVRRAKDFTARGTTEVKIACDIKKKADRKRMCIWSILGVVLILILLAIIVPVVK